MTSCTHILPEIQTRSTKFSNLEMRPPSRLSAVGKGTIMRLGFAIPSARATSFAVWSAPSPAPALRVLVVDDDRPVLKSLREAFAHRHQRPDFLIARLRRSMRLRGDSCN
jgi:hypothetical protein